MQGLRYYSRLCLVFGAFYVSEARSDETPQNVREICRIEVAGALMNFENDISLLRGQISFGEQKVKDLRGMILATEREFQILAQQGPSSIPSFDVDERVVSLRYRLQTLRNQLQESESALELHRKQLTTAEKDHKQWQGLTDSLFVWSQPIDKLGSTAPRQLRYRHACSPYQLLCPLPPPASQAMRKLLPLLNDPQACDRYSLIK